MTDTAEIKRIIQEYCEEVYNIKLNDLEKIDQEVGKACIDPLLFSEVWTSRP